MLIFKPILSSLSSNKYVFGLLAGLLSLYTTSLLTRLFCDDDHLIILSTSILSHWYECRHRNATSSKRDTMKLLASVVLFLLPLLAIGQLSSNGIDGMEVSIFPTSSRFLPDQPARHPHVKSNILKSRFSSFSWQIMWWW